MTEQERKEKYEKFLAVKEQLKKIPGVIDVGVGKKETKGKYTEESVYVVFVEEKKTKEELLPEEIIPQEINGIKTDVVKITKASKTIRPIRGGVKMGSEENNGTGTLGCMATHPTHGTVVLTNHHVLYDQYFDNSPTPVERDIRVSQPDISCSWCCECNVIGLVKDSRRRNNGNVDCGIAKINSDISYINEIDGGIRIDGIAPLHPHSVSGAMVPVEENDLVKKVGAKTGYTEGIVRIIGSPVDVTEEDNSTTRFLDQITFEHIDGTNKRVINKGDSGSVLLNSINQVVGLIMAGSVEEVPFNGVANNIHNVIDASCMNITINPTPAPGGDSATIVTHSRAQSIVTAKISDEESTHYKKYFDKYREKLEQTEKGKDILRCLKQHSEEIRRLVNHNRQVVVAWQRNQGPAYVALLIRKLKNDDENITKEWNGITIRQLLSVMHEALVFTGSSLLKTDMEKYAKKVYLAADLCQTNNDIIELLTS